MLDKVQFYVLVFRCFAATWEAEFHVATSVVMLSEGSIPVRLGNGLNKVNTAEERK